MQGHPLWQMDTKLCDQATVRAGGRHRGAVRPAKACVRPGAMPLSTHCPHALKRLAWADGRTRLAAQAGAARPFVVLACLAPPAALDMGQAMRATPVMRHSLGHSGTAGVGPDYMQKLVTSLAAACRPARPTLPDVGKCYLSYQNCTLSCGPQDGMSGHPLTPQAGLAEIGCLLGSSAAASSSCNAIHFQDALVP